MTTAIDQAAQRLSPHFLLVRYIFTMTRNNRSSRFVCVLLLILALADRTHADTRPKPTHNPFTVATYNVQNMFDTFDDPYTLDEERPTKSPKKIKQITKVIRQLNADMVALQEVENEGLLRRVIDEFLGDMRYRYVVVQPTNSRYGLNLGLISRKPILRVTSHRLLDLPIPKRRRFARDLMHAQIQVTNKKTLELFVAHFKSRYDSTGDPRSNRWRLAEALATHRITRQTLADNPTTAWGLMIGDLNAIPGSPTLECLLQPWPGGEPMWVDMHANLADSRRVTFLHKPYRGTVDYILASGGLAKRAVPNSARVLTDRTLLAGSDHAPVVVTFDLGLSEQVSPNR